MNRYGQIFFFMIVFVLLDLIWLGFIMSSFYAQELGSHISMYGDHLVINGIAAIGAYVCLALGPFFFIFPHANKDTPLGWFALQGALMGLVVYGVYDFTNKAILLDWSWLITLADIAWGMVLYAVSTSFTGYFTRSWK